MGSVSHTGRIGRKEEARHGRMNRQSLQAGLIIDTPPGIPYGFIPMRFDGSPRGFHDLIGGLCSAPPALPDMAWID
ncbi:hypothetical protein [uncultured Duncaniella sp.]|uniref:hypothetical protein n=2 Tax=uncultured Duncaniella sp. TaxID=2768039 RepID=UPI0025AFE7E0|nr:hypothetical protein [uncultured Duncaniella sp.]